MSALELFGFTTGVANVWLLARQNLWNWPIGIINNLAYFYVFFSNGLYGDAGLQLVYLGFGAYGWWVWMHLGSQSGGLAVQRLSVRQKALLAATILGASLALTAFLDRFTDSTVPVADGCTTALSLGAIWAQSRKYLDCWWIWIAADLIYMPLYLYKGLWLTATLYAIFLALCVMGLRAWRADYRTGA